METHDRDELDQAQERLRETWHATPSVALPAGFRDGVMRDVRAAAASSAPEGSAFERAVRLGAMAASFVAIVAGAATLASGMWPSDDLFLLMKSYPDTLVEWLLVL